MHNRSTFWTDYISSLPVASREPWKYYFTADTRRLCNFKVCLEICRQYWSQLKLENLMTAHERLLQEQQKVVGEYKTIANANKTSQSQSTSGWFERKRLNCPLKLKLQHSKRLQSKQPNNNSKSKQSPPPKANPRSSRSIGHDSGTIGPVHSDVLDLKVRIVVISRWADDPVVVARSGACFCEHVRCAGKV